MAGESGEEAGGDGSGDEGGNGDGGGGGLRRRRWRLWGRCVLTHAHAQETYGAHAHAETRGRRTRGVHFCAISGEGCAEATV